MPDTLSFPGPGTAALFGAAIVFAAAAYGESHLLIKSFAIVGGFGLLVVGYWIERETLKLKRRVGLGEKPNDRE